MTSSPLDQTPLVPRTPEDVLAVIPVVLGFEPCDSVVMLTFGGAETFHARVDLPPPGQADEAVALLLDPPCGTASPGSSSSSTAPTDRWPAE